MPTSIWAGQTSHVHHAINVELFPASHIIQVEDEISFPQGREELSELTFALHAALELDAQGLDVKPLASGQVSTVPVTTYQIKLDTEQSTIRLNYSGKISNTSAVDAGMHGIISEEGVFLAGSLAWYPLIEDANVTFSMTVKTPQKWTVVSQGERHILDSARVQWQVHTPQQEIYLIAAPFHEYSKITNGVGAMAFLRQPDQALAERYLDVTAHYIQMYSKLIGPYPYTKFALVENYLQTGYGMPSFTLLGSRVIRLPFILHSSYPHEILHNWWGNGVYVDYLQGNWAEGLTSYLADHLIQEQRGSAVGFRRDILQKYVDFVSSGQDFPLSDFTSKHSVSSEAVGYGKSQLFFHMLRLRIGDEAFRRALQRVYQQFRFRQAGYSDLLHIFQQESGQALPQFFEQWLRRTGAPQIQLGKLSVSRQEKHWQLQGVIKQVQNEAVYQLNLPVAITLEGAANAYQTSIAINKKSQSFTLNLPAKPLRFDADPEFDIFRRVDMSEIPAALSQGFGAERVTLVLPSQAASEVRLAYVALANAWKARLFENADIVYDSALTEWPTGRSVWLLGSQNLFAGRVLDGLEHASVTYANGLIKMDEGSFDPAQQSIILTDRISTSQQTVVWIAADLPAAISGLARKLPHYRKYSYLVFNGESPSIQFKGQWAVQTSSMSKQLEKFAPSGRMLERQALTAPLSLH